MARMATRQRVVVSTIGAWFFGFLIFFPILWMVLASFKTELEAFAIPPSFLFFDWTTENYATVQERSAPWTTLETLICPTIRSP